jgi:hypothetical protein
MFINVKTNMNYQDNLFVNINNNGNIYYTRPMEISIPNYYNLSKYPFDIQEAKFIMGSWG